MHTRNVNVKTAAQESSRKMGGKTVSYTILVAEQKKNSAEETGLNRESESVQTVITDFLANLLHLCEQCDPDGAGIDGFNALLNMAMMHYEQENGGDSEEPV